MFLQVHKDHLLSPGHYTQRRSIMEDKARSSLAKAQKEPLRKRRRLQLKVKCFVMWPSDRRKSCHSWKSWKIVEKSLSILQCTYLFHDEDGCVEIAKIYCTIRYPCAISGRAQKIWWPIRSVWRHNLCARGGVGWSNWTTLNPHWTWTYDRQTVRTSFKSDRFRHWNNGIK